MNHQRHSHIINKTKICLCCVSQCCAVSMLCVCPRVKTGHSTQHRNSKHTRNSNCSKLLIPATTKFDSNSTNWSKGRNRSNLYLGEWYLGALLNVTSRGRESSNTARYPSTGDRAVRPWLQTGARHRLCADQQRQRTGSTLLPKLPDHRGPFKNKRPLKIKEQLQNKRHDVACFLVYQWIGEACSSISLFLK